MWLFLSSALAKCGPGALVVLPGPVLAGQPEIVLDVPTRFEAEASARVTARRAGAASVPLERVRAHEGSGMRQVVYRPTKALSPGRWQIQVGNSQVSDLDVQASGAAPSPWSDIPVVTEVLHEQYGCGDAALAVVSVGHALKGEVIQATLQGPLGTQEARVVVGETGLLTIGHGMCGGTFRMKAGEHELELRLVGSDGALGSRQALSFSLEELPNQ